MSERPDDAPVCDGVTDNSSWLRRQMGTEVQVSPEMVRAGVERALDLLRETDPAYFVSAIYLAMEYERRAALAQEEPG